jgi:hypothetical protein
LPTFATISVVWKGGQIIITHIKFEQEKLTILIVASLIKTYKHWCNNLIFFVFKRLWHHSSWSTEFFSCYQKLGNTHFGENHFIKNRKDDQKMLWAITSSRWLLLKITLSKNIWWITLLKISSHSRLLSSINKQKTVLCLINKKFNEKQFQFCFGFGFGFGFGMLCLSVSVSV